MLKNIHRLSAVFLCFVLMLICWSVGCSEENSGEVITPDNNQSPYDGIILDNSGDMDAVLITGDNSGEEIDAEIKGDVQNIENNAEYGFVTGVHVGNTDDSNLNLHVEGKVEASTNKEAYVAAVYVKDNDLGEETVIRVEESLSSQGDMTDGLRLEADDVSGEKTNTVEVSIGGNVTSISDQSEAGGIVEWQKFDDATPPVDWTVEVEGNVSVTSEEAKAVGVYVQVANGTTTTTVENGIDVTGTSESYGVQGYLFDEAKADLTVNGEIDVQKNQYGAALGIQMNTHDESSAIIKGEGTITSNGNGFVAGIDLDARDGSSESLSYSGDIHATSTGYTAEGITMKVKDTAKIEGKLNGNIEAVSESVNGWGHAAGISMNAQGQGTAQLSVKGNVTAKRDSDEEEAIDQPEYGVKMVNEGGTLDLKVDGNVESSQYGVYISEINHDDTLTSNLDSSEGTSPDPYFGGEKKEAEIASIIAKIENSKTRDIPNLNGVKEKLDSELDSELDTGADNAALTTLIVTGDVTGGEYGLYIDHQSEKHELDVTVEGTVTGGSAPIFITKETTNDNVTLTVWQIETVEVEGEEHVVVTENNTISEATETLEQRINYLIKIEQNEYGNLVASANGTEFADKGIAHENDMVTMRVTPNAGYHVVAVYDDVGKQIQMAVDANGNYYVVVPRGGGIYLSAWIDRDAVEEGDDGDEGPVVISKVTNLRYGSDHLPENYVMGSFDAGILPEDANMIACYSVEQQVAIVLTRTGMTDALAASGIRMKELAKQASDTITSDLSRLVSDETLNIEGETAVWKVITVIKKGKMVKYCFRQLPDGTWVCRILESTIE